MFVRQRRRGSVSLESAIVLPVLFALMLGLVIFGMGTFRYQQLASLAREGARYASVHGASYARDTGQAKATAADIYSNAILPMAVGMDPSQFLPPPQISWDDPSQSPTYQFNVSTNTYRVNYVNVTVSYNWQVDSFPGFPVGTISLTSTSRMPMTY